MGYTTKFEGKLEFAVEPTVAVIRKLKSISDEDCRDHPEWGAEDLTYVDFKVNEAMDGIVHNGAEKTYHAEELVNLVIRLMRQDFPDFGLKGELIAQGEEHDDRWRLVIGDDGWATRVDAPHAGLRVRCPHYDEEFTLGDNAD